ncbi:hypothetical protein Bbelb_367920 [Branchiostoma belcheri]|nr:hypothetical protein Bbelb_419000 [Branchiostoma belcheri]KAI8485429.1 hypothetical protein Bbelb_367920 [Branchiostoma belcheri]
MQHYLPHASPPAIRQVLSPPAFLQLISPSILLTKVEKRIRRSYASSTLSRPQGDVAMATMKYAIYLQVRVATVGRRYGLCDNMAGKLPARCHHIGEFRRMTTTPGAEATSPAVPALSDGRDARPMVPGKYKRWKYMGARVGAIRVSRAICGVDKCRVICDEEVPVVWAMSPASCRAWKPG